ncbi:MMPL family transporter [Corynebacterium sp.]|uniref:MMPL family transporter n=1 Tax=Corynebacterium sp. TaxID=1720 RepID=UPI0026DAE755|nr:MMPL family transporter [Corynebacterium sp.]MDO5077785.1 MMPL family transporter [Corynebacterium sp.]
MAWALLIVALWFSAPPLSDVRSAGNNGALPAASSSQAAETLRETFPDADALPAIITVTGGVTVVLNTDPYSLEAIESLPRITDEAQRIAGDDIHVAAAGVTADNADIKRTIDTDVVVLLPLIFGIIGIILAILLRSWLAPIYLVATLATSFLATLGLTPLITVTLQGDEGISSQIAAYVLVFLTALGVVSSAGLILAVTFAVLMTQPIRELYQFGLAMAVGILIDTFLVRPLLVPALVTLLGDHALTPQKPGTPDAHHNKRPTKTGEA